MLSHRIVSSDNHIHEPVDLWTTRMTPKFRDRAPHIEQLEDGDWWFCDGRKVIGGGGGADAGVRFEDPTS